MATREQTQSEKASAKEGNGDGAGRSLEGRFAGLAMDAGFGPEPIPAP